MQCEKTREFLCPKRIFRNEEFGRNFQQVAYVNYKHEEFIYLLVVMNSILDNVIANKPTFLSYWNYLQLFTLSFCLSIRVKVSWNIGKKYNPFSQAKIKSGIISFCNHNSDSENFSQKSYTDCSWNETIAKHWEDWFQEKKRLA